MKNAVQMHQWKESIREHFSPPFICLILALPVVLLLGVAVSATNPLYGLVIAGSIVMVIMVLLRLDELTITLIIAVHLYVDWYLGLHLVAILMALVLLFAYYLGRSTDRPWVRVRPLWLWGLFLVLTISPAIYGGQFMLYDLASYYPCDILGAFLMYWLGSIIAKDISAIRRVFLWLAVLATLLAIHTLIESVTGAFLFASAHGEAYLASAGTFQISGTNAFRSVSFFYDPNWNGTFFATAFFLPFGLFMASKRPLAKIVFLTQMLLILLALLSTYSTGAWIAILVGMLVFVVFSGRTRSRVQLLVLIAALTTLALTVFSSQLAVQLQHATGADELSLREGAWQTAIRVIGAFPLTGVGLGYQAYLLRANPYRVPAQFVPLAHPHNSYLEWGAMAGIPVLLVFVSLLAVAFWFAWHNWLLARRQLRPLFGGGLAALTALSIGSISINGWTLPPLAAFGWLIAGVITSPLIRHCLRQSTPSADEVTKTKPAQLNMPEFTQPATEDVPW